MVQRTSVLERVCSIISAVALLALPLFAVNAQGSSSSSVPSQSFAVELTDSASTVNAGGDQIYRILLRNTTTGTKEVSVRLSLHGYANLVGPSDGGRHSGNAVLWDKVSVYPGVARMLTVNVQVNPYAPHGALLVAEASSEGRSAVDTTHVLRDGAGQNPLELRVTDGRDTVREGEQLTYTISVRNTGALQRTFTLAAALPQLTTFISASNDYRQDSTNILWESQTIQGGASKEYRVTVEVQRRLPPHYAIFFPTSVVGGPEAASDTTTVAVAGQPASDLTLQLRADMQRVVSGENVTYTLTLSRGAGAIQKTVNAEFLVPEGARFISATAGGELAGDTVRWRNVSIGMNDRKQFQVRVRVEASAEGMLEAEAAVDGKTVSHSVTVGRSESTSSPRMSSVRSAAAVSVSKTIDRSEVLPGGTVTQTIVVRNLSNEPLTGLLVTDRVDPSLLRPVPSTVSDAQIGEGSIQWTIDVLAPGARWEKAYRLDVHPEAAEGTDLGVITTLGGKAIAELPLSDRVRTIHMTVLGGLPTTGAPLDIIFASAMTLLAGISAGLQKRRN